MFLQDEVLELVTTAAGRDYSFCLNQQV